MIKEIQSNRGTKFLKLSSFHFSKRYHRRISCPYTYSQNGVVERKNRHIIETRLSLLLRGGVPFKYQNCAFGQFFIIQIEFIQKLCIKKVLLNSLLAIYVIISCILIIQTSWNLVPFLVILQNITIITRVIFFLSLFLKNYIHPLMLILMYLLFFFFLLLTLLVYLQIILPPILLNSLFKYQLFSLSIILPLILHIILLLVYISLFFMLFLIILNLVHPLIIYQYLLYRPHFSIFLQLIHII